MQFLRDNRIILLKFVFDFRNSNLISEFISKFRILLLKFVIYISSMDSICLHLLLNLVIYLKSL